MFSRAVDKVVGWLASSTGICLIVAAMAIDTILGFLAGFSGAWGNINGAFTGIASMILFALVLHSDVRGNAALHLKLDQLILNDERMDNRFAASEDLPEVELRSMKKQALSQVKEVVQEANEVSNPPRLE